MANDVPCSRLRFARPWFNLRSFVGGARPRTPKIRRGGRVVEGARLESVYTAKPYRGFESLSLRQIRKRGPRGPFFVSDETGFEPSIHQKQGSTAKQRRAQRAHPSLSARPGVSNALNAVCDRPKLRTTRDSALLSPDHGLAPGYRKRTRNATSAKNLLTARWSSACGLLGRETVADPDCVKTPLTVKWDRF